MTGVVVETNTLKSTTLTVCDAVTVVWLLLALARPDTEMVVRPPVIDGVTSTSTAAPVVHVPVHAASVGMWQEIVFPTIVSQLPALLVTLAVALVVSPVVGTVAMKFTNVALSGPLLIMSNVNATGDPAATGLGEGLVVGMMN